MESVSTTALDPLPLPAPSQVRLVFALNVNSYRIASSHEATASRDQPRSISIRYDRLPAGKMLVEDVLGHMADIALAQFPNWYGALIPFAEIDRWTSRFDSLVADLAIQYGLLERGVSIPWSRAARNLCHAGERPLPDDFTRSVHAAQLALAIEPSPLLIALFLHDSNPDPGALHGLARTSEWLAKKAPARVVVVVPDALSASKELDCINFEAVRPSARHDPGESLPEEDSRVSVSPLIGHPNPLSRGEQMLAKRLAQDEMLTGLFKFNIRVPTLRGNQYLVDLLWTDGRLVVEVDGYEFHSDRVAFSGDRRRDYDLMISGYLVLRLPQDEVVEDVELAVEKIRDLVIFRRASGSPRNESLS